MSYTGYWWLDFKVKIWWSYYTWINMVPKHAAALCCIVGKPKHIRKDTVSLHKSDWSLAKVSKSMQVHLFKQSYRSINTRRTYWCHRDQEVDSSEFLRRFGVKCMYEPHWTKLNTSWRFCWSWSRNHDPEWKKFWINMDWKDTQQSQIISKNRLQFVDAHRDKGL